MSMDSALSLSFHIYIFTICTICRTKISWKINIPSNRVHTSFISGYTLPLCIYIHKSYLQHIILSIFQREINAIGEPTSQVITNWDATRGTSLGQRGATRDKSPGTEV